MSAAPGCEFPNPCPVCGADDDHAEHMGPALRAGFGATICPHPSERGHGTGCTCAGVSRETAKRRMAEMLAAPSPLEQRVAALEATVAMLMRKLLANGDITVNDARAAAGLQPIPDLEEVPGAA